MAEAVDRQSEQGAPGRALLPVVAAAGLVKRFGLLTANDRIDLRVDPGEIHALLGENGAGKSTLVKMLYGLLQPDSGTIQWRGEPVVIDGPAAARRLGIGMVFQHFSLFDSLTVAENVALALDGGESRAALARRLAKVSADYGLALEPDRYVHTLSVGERQRIEIVRCLLQDPRLLILDEPTAVLTPQEADQLFRTLGRLAREGRAILYITHRLDEVRRFCHRATILRHGKVVGVCDPRHETPATLARMMIGADVGSVHDRRADVAAGPVRLAVRDLTSAREDRHGVALRGVSFDVRGGEILAIAGVAGNGQAELFAHISGERASDRNDMVAISGLDAGDKGIGERRKLGAAFVPEERLGHAAAPRLSLSDNAILTGHGISRLMSGWRIDRAAALAVVDAVTQGFDVRKGRRDPEAASLSGGNLQKFVVGREILRDPALLVVSQPTWGVDAGAAAIIRQALVDLARRGSAVLMISQDLDEIFQIADRIAVIHDGRISACHPIAEMSSERLGLLMGGAEPVDAGAR
jgi:simple sugar transport system ATP-binding protein